MVQLMLAAVISLERIYDEWLYLCERLVYVYRRPKTLQRPEPVNRN